MKKFAKFVSVAVICFLAIGTVEFMLLRRERREQEQEMETREEEQQPLPVVPEPEDIMPRSISEEGENYVLDIKYPVTGSEEIDASIQEFVEQEKNQFFSEVNSFFEGEEPPGGWPDWKYELIIVYHVFNPASRIVSFKFEGYSFTGGAHGSSVLHTKTFDLASGQEYGLDQVFKEQTPYLDTLARLSREQLKQPDKLGDDYQEFMVEPGTAPDKENFKHFVLKQDSIVFYFEDYQVAPYASGEQHVEFTYSELEQILNPEIYQQQ